jgi:tight adherence protein C
MAILLLAAGMIGLSVFGLRGLLDIQEAVKHADLHRLASPAHWQITRAWIGLLASMPVLFAASSLAGPAWLAAAVVAGLGYAVAPHFLESVRQRVEQEMLDDLPTHLDLIALGLEGGRPLPMALTTCVQRAPAGALQRAWSRVVLDIQGGAEPLEALRAMEQRIGLTPFSSLVTALRAVEKLGGPAAPVFREKARQSAAQRFARAERRARAAPLRLWAALVLCIAPCTVIVLAYPLVRLFVHWTG